MKLHIAENLRRLRQCRNLTQEQLAERLGVSFQAVSRWETGLSYPDIELIPELAAFFDVSTDVLMGVEKSTMEQNLARDKKRLRMGFDTLEEELVFAEECHRMYPHDLEIQDTLIYRLSYYPERHAEMRRLIREYIEHPDADKEDIDQLIRLLISTERDEDLPAALEKYAVEYDLSRSELLAWRFAKQGDSDTARKYRHWHTLLLLSRLFGAGMTLRNDIFRYSPDAERILLRNLGILNFLTGTEGQNLVTGDGEPDLWYGNRLAWGFQLAGNYVLSGRIDEAFAVLDSVVRLYEKFYALPEGTVLTYRCPDLAELRETLRYGVRNPEDVFDFSENLHRCMRSDEAFCGVDLMYRRKNGEEEYDHHVECAAWDAAPLDWECFDAIREDERFQAYVRRMEKYVIQID